MGMPWPINWKPSLSWDQLEIKHLLALAAIALTTMYVIRKIFGKRYSFPPGPYPLPIVGNLLSIPTECMYITFEEMSKKYGDIFTVYFGSHPTVVLNSIEVVREAYLTKAVEFANRPVTVTSDIFGGTNTIDFGQYSPEWKIQRKIGHAALRKFFTGKPLESNLHRNFADLCKSIDKEGRKAFNPHPKLSTMVYNIMSTITFGDKFESDDPLLKYLLANADKVNHIFANGSLVDVFPVLQYFPNSDLKTMKDFSEEIYVNFEEEWYEHLETYKPDKLTDFIYFLISSKNELETKEDGKTPSGMTEEHYINIVTDLFFAGTDTSRATLNWVVLLCAAHPHVQEKMHTEIDAAVGRKQRVSLAHRENLPYTEAVLHEAMRIYPVAPLALPRETSCDVELRGYNLPKGTMVMPNIWALHRNPKEWKDPELFLPERHLNEDGTMAPKPNSFLPFSTGRRGCLGEAVAKVELHLLTAMLFQRYFFAPPAGTQLKVEPIPAGEECIAAPCKVFATRRH